VRACGQSARHISTDSLTARRSCPVGDVDRYSDQPEPLDPVDPIEQLEIAQRDAWSRPGTIL
jgi:hypothetical protein